MPARAPAAVAPKSVSVDIRVHCGAAIFRIVGWLMFNGNVTTATRPAFTEADLRVLAGERSFERGTRYLHAVSSVERIGDQIIATVRGTDDYLVVLTPAERGARGSQRLHAECGCPYGQEGFFCKHCVAVGLKILRDDPRIAAPRMAAPGPRDPAGGTGQARDPEQSSERTTSPADLSAWLGS